MTMFDLFGVIERNLESPDFHWLTELLILDLGGYNASRAGQYGKGGKKDTHTQGVKVISHSPQCCHEQCSY